MRSWRVAGLLFACAVLVAGVLVAGGRPLLAAGSLLVIAVLAASQSPLIFPRSVEAAVAQQRSAADGRPVVYWRPGCPFCIKLRRRLGADARRAHWVNIWTDPAGAAAVRAVAYGNETVPTVVDGDRSFVNPDPAVVRELLRAG
ncbi:MAG TPA: glutaredoxin domain-containing protein [Actinoplanes sp.]|nr:glutaredoxin domain-containing protein [Actinoplanes sp.]